MGDDGRSAYWDKAHGRIYAEWLDLPAWRFLSVHGRALIVELLTRYRPNAENRFELPDRTVSRILNCSRPTAAKTLADLEELGWLAVERVGKMTGAREKRSSAYSLTRFPCVPEEIASKAFMKWRPQEPNGQNSGQKRPTKQPSRAKNCALVTKELEAEKARQRVEVRSFSAARRHTA